MKLAGHGLVSLNDLQVLVLSRAPGLQVHVTWRQPGLQVHVTWRQHEPALSSMSIPGIQPNVWLGEHISKVEQYGNKCVKRLCGGYVTCGRDFRTREECFDPVEFDRSRCTAGVRCALTFPDVLTATWLATLPQAHIYTGGTRGNIQ